MCVSNVEKPSVVIAAFTNMKRLTLKRNPANVTHVKKLLGTPTTFGDLKHPTLQKKPTCINNVGSLC
jgi:hypothetical protein